MVRHGVRSRGKVFKRRSHNVRLYRLATRRLAQGACDDHGYGAGAHLSGRAAVCRFHVSLPGRQDEFLWWSEGLALGFVADRYAERFECLKEERLARCIVGDSEYDVVKHEFS